MKKNKPSLRGSVTQNNVSSRVRMREQTSVFAVAIRWGMVVIVLIALACGGVWLWKDGWPQRQAQNAYVASLGLTKRLHFSVKDVVVQGRKQSSREEILDALSAERNSAIFDLDIDSAAERLGKLPWVNSAKVRRVLPDTVAVELFEREPVARWQKDYKLSVLDATGQVILSAKPDAFSDLPLIVGNGANEAAKDLLQAMKPYPEIARRMKAAVRVGERRWDLHLSPNTVVRMPEDDIGQALHRLSVLSTQEKILDRDLAAIDLRFQEKLIIEPPAAAAEKKETGGKRL